MEGAKPFIIPHQSGPRQGRRRTEQAVRTPQLLPLRPGRRGRTTRFVQYATASGDIVCHGLCQCLTGA